MTPEQKKHRLEYIKAWRQANPDKVKASLERHREERAARTRAYNAAHKERKRAYDRAYYISHPEKLQKYCEKWRQRRKQLVKEEKALVFNHYGNECSCCGEKHIEFLTLDHIHGGGSKHRKSITLRFYSWVIKNNYPDGLRTLCMNCNFATRFGDPCPHQKEKQNGLNP
jgi:hypothetical protein